MNERVVFVLWIVLSFMAEASRADDDIRVGYIYGSVHLTSGHDWNERHHGVYGSYNGWFAGTYIHSYAGVEGYEDDNERAYMAGYEHIFDRGHGYEVSWAVGAVGGYPDDVGASGFLPWAALNFRFGPLKLMTNPFVAVGYGVELKL